VTMPYYGGLVEFRQGSEVGQADYRYVNSMTVISCKCILVGYDLIALILVVSCMCSCLCHV